VTRRGRFRARQSSFPVFLVIFDQRAAFRQELAIQMADEIDRSLEHSQIQISNAIFETPTAAASAAAIYDVLVFDGSLR
jgi:hypothetical protein